MNILKKLLLLVAVAGMMFSAAYAKQTRSTEVTSPFSDVATNYWAYTEINSVVNDGIMSAKDNAFAPEAPISRICFVKSLLKVLGHDDTVINTKNTFKDVTKTTNGYYEILKSKQLGLVYGYPNGNFLPERNMTKAEVTSVVSHITKDAVKDLTVLNQFTDKKDIPSWDKTQYAKAVSLGLYVNYPDTLKFEPNREMTRAEAAVLLYKLKNALNLIKDQYKGQGLQEKILGTEHLNVTKKAEIDTVVVTTARKIINKGNVLEVQFDELFKSKKAGEGDVVAFKFEKDVYTKEGTLTIPANSKLYAKVTEIIPTKWFNKNARVGLIFNKLELPDGRIMNFNGIPFTDDNYLKEGPWETAGKLTAYTVGGAAIGAGTGVAIGVPSEDSEKLGKGLGIGIPVGAVVGLGAGLVTKGLNFVGHEGEDVLILLLSDVSVYN